MLLLSFSFWTQAAFWSILLGIALYLSVISMGWEAALHRVPLIVLCHFANFYVCYSFLIPRYFEKKKFGATILGLVLLLAVLTPVRYNIEKQFMLERLHTRGIVGLPGLTGFVIFSELAIASFASLLRLSVSNQRHKQRATYMQKLQLETELRFLKTQMSPHFLFNTINNIYSLALVKSDKAPEALLKLSDLLRYLLYECHEIVTLKKEIDALHLYKTLFQLKYEHPLDISVLNEIADAEHIRLEPLLLIPLLENALKHSGIGLMKESYAHISIRQDNGELVFQFINSMSQIPLESEVGGIGMQNIRKRLKLQYGDKYTLAVHPAKHQFSVLLKIPAA